MKKISFIFLIVGFVGQMTSQELLHDNGLYYEKPIHSDTSMYRYSNDNITFKPGRVFVYDYYYLDSTGVKMKFIKSKVITTKNPRNLTDYNNPTDSAIDKVSLTVTDWELWRSSINKFDSSYTQTICNYNFILKKNKGIDHLAWTEGVTGVIDNWKNIWIHPPRDYGFKILELNPFPFYYIDEKIKQWTWTLDVGGFWLDPRWINHKETIAIKSEYTRSSNESLSTSLGDINCKVINAIGSADLGNKTMKTYLKSYFNPLYGFVKLEYINVDGTKIVMQLIDVK